MLRVPGSLAHCELLRCELSCISGSTKVVAGYSTVEKNIYSIRYSFMRVRWTEFYVAVIAVCRCAHVLNRARGMSSARQHD